MWSYAPGHAVAFDDLIDLSANGAKGEFVDFTDAVASSGNKVEVESEISFGGGSRKLPLLPADAQCSLAYLREGLKVYSAEGWTAVTCAVPPDWRRCSAGRCAAPSRPRAPA